MQQSLLKISVYIKQLKDIYDSFGIAAPNSAYKVMLE
jgi:hypothetical protein